jgi:hypothetical protein
MRYLFRAAGPGLIALACLSGLAEAPFLPAASARAVPAPQQIGGTWELRWKNRRGEPRTGTMVIRQRGSQLSAEVHERGGATAMGSISGSNFILEGRRLVIPFTVTGRVQRGRMTGSLSALGVEQYRFTGVRRRGGR